MMNRLFLPVDKEHQQFPDRETILPSRADTGSAGYDFHSKEKKVIPPRSSEMFWTDVKAQMLDDEVLMIYSRSSYGKYSVTLANSVGVIDGSYYSNPKNDGNIGVLLTNHSDAPFIVHEGDMIAQGIFMDFYVTGNDRPRKKTRSGGFGSSGK